MFFNDNNTNQQKNYYVSMLKMMGSLSNLFSTNDIPYLDSRVTENLFCRCLGATNLSRSDITADAKKNRIGIGIKTWIGTDFQKIAEFDKVKFSKKSTEEFINTIAKLRNERIDFTMRNQNIKEMIYHCTRRRPGVIQILECPLDNIELNKIRITSINDKSISFCDGRNKYRFVFSKSTLYKDFSEMDLLKEIHVEIIEDPFKILEKYLIDFNDNSNVEKHISKNIIYLPLYSYCKKDGSKKVEAKSGLNQRFAGGRERNPYEVYIPIPKEFRDKYSAFFPDRDEPFNLILPNGNIISAKVCQDGGKAIMSNPNSALGKWLIDEVFKISNKKLLTFDIINKYGIDSVMIEKKYDKTSRKYDYYINFAKTDSYEKFIGRYDSNI